MTKIKLVDGTIIDAVEVVLESGILKISTLEKTVEELAEIFSDKEKTNLIIFMTESEKQTGFKKGFTSFAGIKYDSEGLKTIVMFQPIDATEERISNAEGAANLAEQRTGELEATVNALLGV